MSEFAILRGRTAVVTGGSSGIGQAIARQLGQAGADVVVGYCRNREGAAATADAVRDAGQRAATVPADLGNPQHLQRFVDTAWEQFGPVDIWVNNAGADLLTGEGAGLDYPQKLQRLWELDVRATVLLSRASGARMQLAGQGTILNIGWDQAATGMEGESGELFAAAKNAIMGFTRSLALSLAPQVRVNCIAPGWIRTAWGEQAAELWQERVRQETPLQRWGTPDDIAALARFLVSHEADYITGQVINANGGAVR